MSRVFSSRCKNHFPLFNEGGSIVLTGSVAGSKGVEGLSVYGATKARRAVIGSFIYCGA